MKRLWYGNEKAPGLDDTIDEEQLAIEGQALLKYFEQKYGKET